MMTTLVHIALSAILTTLGASQTPTSTFDKNNEGWKLGTYATTEFTGPYKSFGPAIWVAKGGNPKGCAYCNDVESFSDTFFLAPKKFLGGQSAMYGGRLTYDLNDTDGNEANETAAVVLKGAGITICFASKQLPATKAGKFTHFTIPMTENGWTKDKYHGSPVSSSEFKKVIGSLTELAIRSEYHTGADDCHLDNVRLTARPTKAPAKKPAKK